METIWSMSSPDHYAVLGVAPESEDVVIRAAYKALMMKYHPDRRPGAEGEARAKRINEAYAVLGDAVARARYDAARRPGAGQQPPPPPPPQPSPSPSVAKKPRRPMHPDDIKLYSGIGTALFFLGLAVFRCTSG